MEVTTSRKEELRQSIIARRHARGESDITVEFSQPQHRELTSMEMEKKERRREQNRRAAQRCRSKKRMTQFSVIQNFERVIEDNHRLRKEVAVLRRERDNLRSVLHNHKLNCSSFPEIKVEPEDDCVSGVVEMEQENILSLTTLVPPLGAGRAQGSPFDVGDHRVPSCAVKSAATFPLGHGMELTAAYDECVPYSAPHSQINPCVKSEPGLSGETVAHLQERSAVQTTAVSNEHLYNQSHTHPHSHQKDCTLQREWQCSPVLREPHIFNSCLYEERSHLHMLDHHQQQQTHQRQLQQEQKQQHVSQQQLEQQHHHQQPTADQQSHQSSPPQPMKSMTDTYALDQLQLQSHQKGPPVVAYGTLGEVSSSTSTNTTLSKSSQYPGLCRLLQSQLSPCPVNASSTISTIDSSKALHPVPASEYSGPNALLIPNSRPSPDCGDTTRPDLEYARLSSESSESSLYVENHMVPIQRDGRSAEITESDNDDVFMVSALTGVPLPGHDVNNNSGLVHDYNSLPEQRARGVHAPVHRLQTLESDNTRPRRDLAGIDNMGRRDFANTSGGVYSSSVTSDESSSGTSNSSSSNSSVLGLDELNNFLMAIPNDELLFYSEQMTQRDIMDFPPED